MKENLKIKKMVNKKSIIDLNKTSINKVAETMTKSMGISKSTAIRYIKEGIKIGLYDSNK